MVWRSATTCPGTVPVIDEQHKQNDRCVPLLIWKAALAAGLTHVMFVVEQLMFFPVRGTAQCLGEVQNVNTIGGRL